MARLMSYWKNNTIKALYSKYMLKSYLTEFLKNFFPQEIRNLVLLDKARRGFSFP